MFKKTNLTPYRLFNYIMIVYLVTAIYQLIINFIYQINTTNGYSYTEFLINYQGGFVRRGLLGEIIFNYSLLTNTMPAVFIIVLSILSFFIVSIFFIYQFSKYKICWWILPLSFTLLGGDEIRKDYLCMIFVILITYVLKLNIDTLLKIFFIYFLTLILWNLHEAFFFVIGIFTIFYLLYDTKSSKHISIRIVTVTPIIIFFIYTCLHKGNIEVAQSIQSSWHNLFPNLFSNQVVRNSIGALGWNTIDTFKFHLQMNFGSNNNILGLLVRPISYITIYYTLSRFIFTFSDNNSILKNKDNSLFSTILIFQFISLSPLFFFLSCDYSRIYMYWTISSFSIFFVLGFDKEKYFFSSKVINLTKKINNKIDWFVDWLSLPKKQLICLIILFVGISTYFFSFNRAISGSVIGVILTYFSKILIFIKNLIL